MNSLRTKIVDRCNIKYMIMQLQTSAASVNQKYLPEIQIPMRKERGPTDILRALESILSNDITAANYKFMDDPLFIPSSELKSRNYILSRESGIRAARWIIKEHDDLLRSELSEPLIEAFLPPKKYTDKSEVSNEMLMKLIREGSLTDALHVYNLLEENVPLETKQAILEIMCYYNGEICDLSEEYPEEQKYLGKIVMNTNTWKDDSKIIKLFEELKENETTAAAAYSAMICGTAKYFSIDAAVKLHQECVDKNIPVATKAYSYLIQRTCSLKKNVDDCIALIENYLQLMVCQKNSLDLEILNSILKSVSTFYNKNDIRVYIAQVLTTFKSFGIQPSLASYYYMLLIYYPTDGYDALNSKPLQQILNELKKKELLIQDANDIQFFSTAMAVIQQNYFGLTFAHELHKIVQTNNNHVFIQKEENFKTYYHNYLLIVLNNEPLENFVEFYESLVPQTFIPNPELMKAILEVFFLQELNLKLINLLPKFLSHIILFELLYNNNLIKLSFRTISKYSRIENNVLKEKCADYAWNVWKHIEVLKSKLKYNVSLSSEVFSSIIILLISNNEFDKMLKVLTHLNEIPSIIKGVLNTGDLELLFKQFIQMKQTEAVLVLLEYIKEHELLNRFQSYITNLKSALHFDMEQKQRLELILGMKNSTSNKKKSPQNNISVYETR